MTTEEINAALMAYRAQHPEQRMFHEIQQRETCFSDGAVGKSCEIRVYNTPLGNVTYTGVNLDGAWKAVSEKLSFTEKS